MYKRKIKKLPHILPFLCKKNKKTSVIVFFGTFLLFFGVIFNLKNRKSVAYYTIKDKMLQLENKENEKYTFLG